MKQLIRYISLVVVCICTFLLSGCSFVWTTENGAAQSQQFVEESFSGSLPAFITAFTRRKKLTEDEIAELQKLIDQNRR